MKYIFVTGGVVSSLGKGLTAASLAALLEARDLRVNIQKFDPYLNVDPGTMNPYQHGEIFVLEDGYEADLDLGHYERFTNAKLDKYSNLTSGRVYLNVIENERKGAYLGETVQVIPHITDEIKRHLRAAGNKNNPDIIITEIGGTVGDIEILPFLEAARQLQIEEEKGNVAHIHLTLIPYLPFANELKTKPTQQSVAKLREIGISPTVIICRSSKPVPDELRKKISLFTNVPFENVIPELDVTHSVYELPLSLHQQGLDELICENLKIKAPKPKLQKWRDFYQKIINPNASLSLAIAGKYNVGQDTYYSISHAIIHASAALNCKTEIEEIDANGISNRADLDKFDCVIIPGGFGQRGIESKIKICQLAREKEIPLLGICLGMQVICIEFARNELEFEDANSEEFDEKTRNPVIHIQEEQKSVKDKGASMRLGAYDANILAQTKCAKYYKKKLISERHRHRYEFNNKYRELFNKKGLSVAAESPDGKTVEVVELEAHPFHIGCQFHPEFKSKPNSPHPLFLNLLKVALKKQKQV